MKPQVHRFEVHLENALTYFYTKLLYNLSKMYVPVAESGCDCNRLKKKKKVSE